MPSFWGSQKDGAGEGNQSAPNSRPGSRRYSNEPDERTTLLQGRARSPRADGYLDPDDPAVSPYNLWTVRFTRYLTILFLMVTFLWWVLLLVSIFISPPGMHTRGSGFYDFAFTCLTLGNLLSTVLFFSAPSQAMRVCTAIIAVFLLIDMIIILAVKRLRQEESWVGITSVVWAVIMATWCIMTDRIVAWGKREEEVRLTGREETRRSVKEWLSVLLATIILAVYIVISILMTGTIAIRAKDASLTMAGNRYYVDGHKYQVHLACVGNVTYTNGTADPTVLLEAGEYPSEYEFESWIEGAWQNGTISRYCYWDRPGYAWSDSAPSPHSAGMSSDALSEALAVAGEEGPWILVSAGYGSIVSRIFSARHPHDIAGLFLIDPLHEDLLHRIGEPGRGFVLWGWGIISPLGLSRLGGAIFQGRTSADRVYGRNAYQGGKFIKAQLQENLIADSLTKNEVRSARTIQLPDTPLVLISSGIETRKDEEWEKKQKDLTTLTNNLVSWDVINKAPHQVWQTFDGRHIMEKSLGKLVKVAAKFGAAMEERRMME